MTNDQHEKDSVMRGLQDRDHVSALLRKRFASQNESRREYVNRYNLNKVEPCAGCAEPDQHISMVD